MTTLTLFGACAVTVMLVAYTLYGQRPPAICPARLYQRAIDAFA